MLPSFKDTTSRHAIIVGMTNTDQIGLQQAKAPAAATIPEHAERIPDDDAGGGGDGGAGGEINEATGLTAEEQAEFDRMSQGGDDPEPPPPGDDLEIDPADDPDADDEIDPATPPAPLGREKTAAELAAETAAGKKPSPKTVSYGKYQRELKAANAKAAALEATQRTERENRIKLEERVAIINEALAAAANQPPPVDPNAPPENPFEEADIDPEVDYAASVKQVQRRQRYQMDHQQRTETEFTESREDTAMRQTFERDFQAVASSEAGKHLPDAYQFLKDSRLTEICISEFDKDPNDPNEIFTPAEVQKMVDTFNAEEKWVVSNALKNSKSPAMAIMKLARSRGWKPPAAAAAPAAPAAPRAPAAPAARVPAVRNGNGAPPPAVPDAAAALAELRAAQEAGRSLSDGGGAPPQGLSADMILKLDDDEFAELIDSLPKHQLDALMGRTPGG